MKSDFERADDENYFLFILIGLLSASVSGLILDILMKRLFKNNESQSDK